MCSPSDIQAILAASAWSITDDTIYIVSAPGQSLEHILELRLPIFSTRVQANNSSAIPIQENWEEELSLNIVFKRHKGLWNGHLCAGFRNALCSGYGSLRPDIGHMNAAHTSNYTSTY